MESGNRSDCKCVSTSTGEVQAQTCGITHACGKTTLALIADTMNDDLIILKEKEQPSQ